MIYHYSCLLALLFYCEATSYCSHKIRPLNSDSIVFHALTEEQHIPARLTYELNRSQLEKLIHLFAKAFASVRSIVLVLISDAYTSLSGVIQPSKALPLGLCNSIPTSRPLHCTLTGTTQAII
jgi:hypothetical protein